MLSKISKSLVKSVRANQVCDSSFLPINSLMGAYLFIRSPVWPQEASPVLTRMKMPSERVPLIKITGKSHMIAFPKRFHIYLNLWLSI